ncbi:MAG TPA: rhomboid family intramembrane serine protease, partial [Spirochaetia bacterium]|nr:rhomboid family intramembrane serine protease [Spirochaetia bacterium]
MIPLRDDNSDRRSTPVVNYLIIAANIFVFMFLQDFGTNYEFTYAYSTVPAEILTGKDIVTEGRIVRDAASGESYVLPGLSPTPISVYLTLITSMFMHGGIGHILGNMLYLFIFGDNVEDRMGHLRYLFFYILCGVIASLAHVFSCSIFGNSLYVPSLGASGAISAILAAYMVLFPGKRVLVLILRFITPVPAVLAIGVWFLFQLINGLWMLGGGSGGGVAYAAHI